MSHIGFSIETNWGYYKTLELNVSQISPLLSRLITKALRLVNTVSYLNYSNNPWTAPCVSSMTTRIPASQCHRVIFLKLRYDHITPLIKTLGVFPLPTSQVWTWLAWHSRSIKSPFLDLSSMQSSQISWIFTSSDSSTMSP